MARLSATAVLICIAFNAFGNAQRTSLKTALDRGLIIVTAAATGKIYHDKALRLTINNTTRSALQLTIDPALIFKPNDQGYQTLVLPAEEMMALAPGGSISVEVQTFCGRMRAAAPAEKLSYTLWKQGDSTMIKVTQYIHKHSLYGDLGQEAIWALTDRHNLEGIIDPSRPRESAELLALLTKETGWATPEYFKLYKLSVLAGQPIFQQRLLKIISNIDWKLDATMPVTLGIYNATGDLVQGVLDEKSMAKGAYKMQVKFEAEGAPPGPYFMRLKVADKLVKELKVMVE